MPTKNKIELNGVRENICLSSYTTFQIGGQAKYFFVAKSEKDIVEAINWAKQEKMNYFILGGGSNLLVSDDGFDGLIVKNENIDFFQEGTKVVAGSGLNLGFFVNKCLESDLTGAEFLAGIPGTVGGAVRGNAGAWGNEIGQIVESVKIFDGKSAAELDAKNCHFEYRGSLIKEKNYAILSVTFKLVRGDVVTAEKQMRDYQWQRSTKQPLDKPCAGSIFKNVKLTQSSVEMIKKELDITDEEFADLTKSGQIPAGYIISRLDLQGKIIGGAQISTKHANFIVNINTAVAGDVIGLISLIKQQVRDRLGIQLEEEIQYLGF
ncbi:MAG: UDP-N-acetylmuramate dehydrogenase [Patescibacteria group bacterium]|jgi:UDP-N-acetylmuramate dehydrogenase